MGRKIEIKKVEDTAKCQVTYSKRRKSLLRKAEEISIMCDIDIAFLAFSPSGRASMFCNCQRIDDLINSYANLPIQKRLSHIKNVMEKMEKLHELGYIKNVEGKFRYLNDQIENLEILARKRDMELHLSEDNLRNYEVKSEQDATLEQLAWCERNLQQCIDKVKERKELLPADDPSSEEQPYYNQKGKSVMGDEGGLPFSYKNGGNQVHSAGSSSTGALQFQPDPWSGAKVPENIFTEVLEKQKPATTISEAPQPNLYSQASNIQTLTSYDHIQQFGTGGVAPGAENGQCSYAPIQMDYQAPMPWQQQGDSNPPFATFAGETGNMAQNYSSYFQPNFTPSSLNGVPTGFTEASNTWMMDFTPANQQTIPYQQDHMVFNNNASNEDNHIQDGYGNWNADANNMNNHGTYDPMNQSPAQFQDPPSGYSNQLPNVFHPEGPFGDYAPWTHQGIQQTGIWEGGNQFFQQTNNSANFFDQE